MMQQNSIKRLCFLLDGAIKLNKTIVFLLDGAIKLNKTIVFLLDGATKLSKTIGFLLDVNYIFAGLLISTRRSRVRV